jgi:hypothetical protein
MSVRLSIIVASSGRPTLSRTVESITTQMRPGDELLVDVNDDAPWGHAARNRMMPRAAGDFLLFMDDDDVYCEGALDVIRSAARQPDRVHMFRMCYAAGGMLWQTETVECGNVSTQMVVVPNKPGQIGHWGNRYEGDFDFIKSTCRLQGEPVWHEDVIALVRPL